MHQAVGDEHIIANGFFDKGGPFCHYLYSQEGILDDPHDGTIGLSQDNDTGDST